MDAGWTSSVIWVSQGQYLDAVRHKEPPTHTKMRTTKGRQRHVLKWDATNFSLCLPQTCKWSVSHVSVASYIRRDLPSNWSNNCHCIMPHTSLLFCENTISVTLYSSAVLHLHTPSVVEQYLSVYLGRVMEMHICYCNSRNGNRAVFYLQFALDSSTDDATSAN